MVISLFIMLAGLICINRLPVAEFPEVAPPTVVVATAYPGASAEVIASTVAAPIEEQVNSVEGISYYSSKSDNLGNYNLTLIFEPGTDPDMALVNVNNAIKRAERLLPNEVTMNGVMAYKRTADFLGIVAFTGDREKNPELTNLFLSNYVSNNVKDTVARIDGVGQAIIFGELKYSMRVWLDPLKMRALNVSPDEVQTAIRGQNIQAATGSLGTEGASNAMQFKLNAQGRLKEVSEFENIIIRSGAQGRQIRLSDIAKVELGQETYSGTPAFNGNPAVLMAVLKLSEGNAVDIVNKTKALIGELSQNFPEGMNWTIPYDTTKFVRSAMKEIIETLILTFILVVLITYVFLQDWRATIVPAVAIPVSLIGTFLFLYVAGMSINTLTMFALILVIGSVVDDAICVVECCVRLIQEEQLSPKEAAFRTMRELTGALVATTLVVIAVYTPIAFYGGMVGTIYQQFSFTMCVALILSSVVALTLSPALCALVLKDKSKQPNTSSASAFSVKTNSPQNSNVIGGGFMSQFIPRTLLLTVAFALILIGFLGYFYLMELSAKFLMIAAQTLLIVLVADAVICLAESGVQLFYKKRLSMENAAFQILQKIGGTLALSLLVTAAFFTAIAYICGRITEYQETFPLLISSAKGVFQLMIPSGKADVFLLPPLWIIFCLLSAVALVVSQNCCDFVLKENHESHGLLLILKTILSFIQKICRTVVDFLLGRFIPKTLCLTIVISLSFLVVFYLFGRVGTDVHIVTTFTLILGIGLFVDAVICVAESCAHLIRNEHLSFGNALSQTILTLFGTLTLTVLAGAAVFTSIAYFSGRIAEHHDELPSLIYSVRGFVQFIIPSGNAMLFLLPPLWIRLCLLSAVVVTVSQFFCDNILKDSHESHGGLRFFNIGINFTRDGYIAVGSFLARFIPVTVVVLVAVLFGNYSIYEKVPKGFLPQEDKGGLMCEAVLPQGASLSRTQAILAELVEMVKQIDGVEAVLTVPGQSMTAGNGENMGMFIAELKAWEERKTVATAIEHIQMQVMGRTAAIAEAKVLALVPPSIQGLGQTGGVTFALQATGGQTPQELSQAANQLAAKIMATGKAMMASTSFDTNTPMLNLEVDRDKAEAMNVPVGAIFNTLQTQLGSMYVNDFNLFAKTYKVKVQAEPEYRDNLNVVSRLTVPARDGTLVPVDSVASVAWSVGPRQMERFNMFPSANFNVMGSPGVSSGDMMQTIQDIVQNEFSHDYQIAWTDLSYQEKQNSGQIIMMMILAIAFAYLFLTAQYESWTTPISVMLSVATATLGGLIALKILGRSLDIYCQLGLLMLIGLTAKTAILMVEYSKQLRDDGMSLYEAAIGGMRVRFRAVMMTALSFVIGVYPMVIATGAGAASRRSIGVTTFWGMIAATIVGMMLIPGLYVLTRSMSEATKRLCGFKLPENQNVEQE
jgi:multidrug efflux pump subunit AcrB